MPYALLSDIHGNMRAFDAVLAGGHTRVQWTTDRKPMPYAEFAVVSGRAVEFRHCGY